MRSLRHHGWSPSDRYDDMPRAAFNYRLSDVLCALGIPQLRRLDELLAARERVADAYAERLHDIDAIAGQLVELYDRIRGPGRT